VNNVSEIYAIIVEPLNASTMHSCSEDFLRQLRTLCSNEDIVLIFDEVYSGWGKTGTLFNFQRVDGVLPDILTYAKSFGGGKASISGYSYTSKVAKAYDSIRDATLHSTTYYGFGEEVITAIEALNIIKEEGLVERSAEIGNEFRQLLEERSSSLKNFEEIRGSGALWGIMLKADVIETCIKLLAKMGSGKLEILADPRIAKKVINSAVVAHLYEEHGILTYFGVNVENPLIISFPLVATRNEVSLAAKAVGETLEQDLTKLVLKFVRLKLTGPKANLSMERK
jgi:putrescine aminotransferase